MRLRKNSKPSFGQTYSKPTSTIAGFPLDPKLPLREIRLVLLGIGPVFGLKMYSLFLGRLFSIPVSFSEMWNIRGLLPFSGDTLTVLLSTSKSVNLSLAASPIL